MSPIDPNARRKNRFSSSRLPDVVVRSAWRYRFCLVMVRVSAAVAPDLRQCTLTPCLDFLESLLLLLSFFFFYCTAIFIVIVLCMCLLHVYIGTAIPRRAPPPSPPPPKKKQPVDMFYRRRSIPSANFPVGHFVETDLRGTADAV